MEPMHIYVLAALSFLVGATLQSMIGFGFGIVVMTLLPFFMPSYGLCLAIQSILGFCMAFFIAVQKRRYIEWKLLLPQLLAFVPVNIAAVWVSSVQPDDTLRRVLGVFLFLLGLYFALFASRITIRPLPRNGVIAGAASGVLNGLFGVGGPPVVLYMLSVSRDEERYIINLQAFFTCSNIITLCNRYVSGQLTPEVLPFTAIGVVMLLVGTRLGRWLFRFINAEGLRRIVYGVISLSGLLLLI